MIVTIDVSPKVVREYFVEKTVFGSRGSYRYKEVYSSGIATDCARIIGAWQEPVHLIVPLNPGKGRDFRNGLEGHTITVEEVPLREEALEELLLTEEYAQTIFSSPEPRMTRESFNDLYYAFQENCVEGRIVLLTEQNREDLPKDFRRQLARLCFQRAVPNVVTCRGKDVGAMVEEKPFFLVMYKEDLEEYTKLKINFAHEGQKAANVLFDKGVGNVLILGSGKDAILCTKSGSYRISLPEEEPRNTWSLNFVAAGVALGLLRKYDLGTTLKLAVALGQVSRPIGGKVPDVTFLKGKMNGLVVKELV